MVDIFANEIIFEPEDNFPKSDIEIPKNVPEIHREVMKEFLTSGYFFNKGLNIDRFLGEDSTIDLEKLELGIILAIEFLEFSVKSKKPIYIFLRNMDKYFALRHIDPTNIERITEESSFVLGFCQAVADNESINKKVFIQYERNRI